MRPAIILVSNSNGLLTVIVKKRRIQYKILVVYVTLHSTKHGLTKDNLLYTYDYHQKTSSSPTII